ncbi:MAG: 4-(cytidine 5'-diphospho)-2-C-methyl-D-erythritol kinase [Planctomycetes bacterium]|nr:4-(cytidine 5'-diphospho)-2-C-methyl-D-erythritol kinase [Planctomycetota bacterium]
MNDKEQFESVGRGLLVRAPAKINLSLLVVRQRPDGFHELETIMAKVNWYDEILIERGDKDAIELICKGPNWAPQGRDNLVWRAAEMLLEGCRPMPDVRITLTKNIPAGTGLGSASSDAAATLIGLNRYLKLDLDRKYLFNVAANLGSDVAFLLNGPLARCTGKGEKIEKIREDFNFMALLLLSDVSVSTQEVYANYRHRQALYEKLSARISSHIRENRIDLVARMCANMLEESCFDLAGSLAELKEKSGSLGIGSFCLSGSGSAMFCIVDSGDEEQAEECKRRLEEKLGCRSIVVANNRW